MTLTIFLQFMQGIDNFFLFLMHFSQNSKSASYEFVKKLEAQLFIIHMPKCNT